VRQERLQELEEIVKEHPGKLDNLEETEVLIVQRLSDYREYTIAMKKLGDIAESISDTPSTETVESLKETLESRLNDIATEIEDNNSKKIEYTLKSERLKLEKEKVVCPKCKSDLRFCDSGLVAIDSDTPVPEQKNYAKLIREITRGISLLRSEESSLRKYLPQLSDLKIPNLQHTDPEFYENLEDHHAKLENTIKIRKETDAERQSIEEQLETESLGVTVSSLKKKCVRKRESFESLLADTDTDLRTTEELDTALEEIQKSQTLYSQLCDNVDRATTASDAAQSRLDKVLKDIQVQTHKLGGINRQALETKLEMYEKRVQKTTDKQDEDTRLSSQVDDYLNYVERSGQLDQWETKRDAFDDELKASSLELTGFLGLKERIAQAEVMAVDSVIASINEHTAHYLDTFFADDKLSVTIGMDPESPTKFVNNIEYKGNEYSSITQLSGGEFDRVTLASVCGINSMLGSPLLILDESLSSLDSEANTEIISFLHELATDKLVIVCSHEAVEGIFDTVIRF